MKALKTEEGWLLVLERGEEVVEAITSFVKEKGLEGGQIRAIGGVADVTLGWYDLDAKEYRKKRFEGNFELVALLGNVSLVDGEVFCHLHAAVSGPDYALRGGHLFEARVSITAEVEIRPGPRVERRRDDFTALNLLAP